MFPQWLVLSQEYWTFILLHFIDVLNHKFNLIFLKIINLMQPLKQIKGIFNSKIVPEGNGA